MDLLHERCAGLDISKKDAKACVRTPSMKRRGSFTTETTTWGSTTNAVLALRDHLLAAEVKLVVIEATSDYWKPFYYLLVEDLDVILVNARQVKNLPGRKTDVSDAAWLAQLGAHGLVRPSFVPPQPVRELRDLTRARTQMTRERGQIVQRVEKLLEDTGIKLATVAADIMGVSGRAMLEALIAGECDPQALAELAKRRMRSKIPELIEALTGRFRDHHAFLARLYLDQYDQLTGEDPLQGADRDVQVRGDRGRGEIGVGEPGVGQVLVCPPMKVSPESHLVSQTYTLSPHGRSYCWLHFNR